MFSVQQLLTHTIVAAPAGDIVGCISHLLQGLGTQVAQLPQTAVVEDPCANLTRVQVVGRPHLAHVTHLIAGRLLDKAETPNYHLPFPFWSFSPIQKVNNTIIQKSNKSFFFVCKILHLK